MQLVPEPGPLRLMAIASLVKTLTDTGQRDLDTSAVSVLGMPDFAVVGSSCRAALRPGQDCTVTIRFAPASAGPRTAQLVFAPNSDVLAAAQQQVIQAGLQQWLSDVIRVQSVDVAALDATLTVTVVYVVLQTQQQQTQEFVYGGAQA